jgi:hypothetical protein
MSTCTRRALLASALLAAFPLAALSADPDPLLGSWQLNLPKSRFNPAPGPRGQLRIYTRDGDIEKLTSKGVGADGKPALVRYSARYDGKDYAITGSAGGELISLRRIDDFTTQSTQKQAGKPAIITTRTVSRDGQTLVVTTQGTGPHGEKLDHRMVFDKRT